MRDTVSVLGVLVDRGDMDSTVLKCRDFMKCGGAVFTPNPEIIMRAYGDSEYMDVLNRADMIIPDGIGVVIGSKILRKPVKERVAGYDLTCNMLRIAAQENIPVYIYGGRDGVAKAAAEKIEKDYGANVCGYQHGYHKDTSFIVDEINEKKPGILLVCLGAPKQEIWINENRSKLPPCLMIGAGGSVDVLSGQTKRAPKFFIKLNLEWFYRLLCQPTRFVRMLQLPKFIITVFFKGERQGGKKMIKVTLLEHTPDPQRVVAAAAKLCYSHSGVCDIYDGLTDEKVSGFINMLSDIGHESPIEHVTFTFGIEGVSRSLTHQLVRHRIASYSQKSQRYVTEGNFEYIIPPEIEGDEKALEIFKKAMEDDQKTYDALTAILKEKHKNAFMAEGKDEKEAVKLAEKKAIEDARYVLPNACETKIVATFNARSLMNFFKHRLCERAQWEIRDMATKMYLEVSKIAPELFKKAGPPCAFGKCPEGKMSCGKMEEKRKIFRGDK